MNAYIALTEENDVYVWSPRPNEQYQQPPADAICWVSGETDEELLQAARGKFGGLGFEIVSAEFYRPGPGEKSIHLMVKERTDTSEITVGQRSLVRRDKTKGGIVH